MYISNVKTGLYHVLGLMMALSLPNKILGLNRPIYPIRPNLLAYLLPDGPQLLQLPLELRHLSAKLFHLRRGLRANGIGGCVMCAIAAVLSLSLGKTDRCPELVSWQI